MTPPGNVATIVTADGTVVEQAAYSPYGRPDQAGSARTADSSAPDSQLGFQTAINDPDTGTVILGPRQYDPATTTFTSQDFFPAAGADRTLATDPLTGNRYLFAASNPVAFHDDGHLPEAAGSGPHYPYETLDTYVRAGRCGSYDCVTQVKTEGFERIWAKYAASASNDAATRARQISANGAPPMQRTPLRLGPHWS